MKKIITGHEPAFNTPYQPRTPEEREMNGLTIRQELAVRFYAARLTGLSFNLGDYSRPMLAELSVQDADSLIEELNKGD